MPAERQPAAALAPGGARRTPCLADKASDPAGGAAPEPLLAIQDQAASDAGSPPDTEHGLERFAGAELELTLDRNRDVVADPNWNPELLGEMLSQGKGALPAWEVAGVRDDARLLVSIARRAHSDAAQVARLELGLRRGLGQRLRHLARDVLGAAGGGCGPPGLAEDLVVGIHHDGL